MDRIRQFSIYKTALKQCIGDICLDDLDMMPSETKSLFIRLGPALKTYFETKGESHNE